MKKYLVLFMLVALVYFTSGGCGAKAANAMPIELYWFVITSDIGEYMKNINPVPGTAMPADNFVIQFDIEPKEPSGYIPTPQITSLVGVLTVTETPLTDREGNHYSIKINDLSDGQKVTMSIED